MTCISKPKAYLASPLGFMEAGRFFMDRELVPLIEKAGFDVLNPWKLTQPELLQSASCLPYGEQRRSRWKEINPMIGSNNARSIREATVMVAVLDGPDVDSGTAAEIGYASALGKPIIGYRNDFRFCGDNEGSVINLQVEYFVCENGGTIVTDLPTLQKALELFRSRLTAGSLSDGRMIAEETSEQSG